MVVAAAVLPALAGCGQSEFDMRGEFYASGSITSQMRPPCYGYRGMSDLNQGTSVTVYDASGTIVGAGVLGSGTSPDRMGCMFPFEVKGVPAGEDFYQVEISHRGRVTVSAEDAQAGRVKLQVTS